MLRDDDQHGERRTYVRGCRCDACARANAAYCKRYRSRAHKSGGAIRVDAGKARRHLTAMSEFYTKSAMGSLAAMNSSAIYRIQSGLQPQVTREVEARILAIKPGEDVGGQWVPAIYAARRIQALTALGYSVHWQAVQLGYQKQNMIGLIRGEKPFITSTVDQRIREHYERHSMTPPSAASRFERASITKAKNMAATHGWVPPLAWNNIDDPNEVPDVGATLQRGDSRRALVENFDWLVSQGESPEGAASRLGIQVATIANYRSVFERKVA